MAGLTVDPDLAFSVRAAAREAPHDLAVSAPDRDWTWRQWQGRVEETIAALRRRAEAAGAAGLDSTGPGTTGLDSTAPDSMAPDSTAPDSTAPDSTAPDSTAPELAFRATPGEGTLALVHACLELGWTLVPVHSRWTAEEGRQHARTMTGSETILDPRELGQEGAMAPRALQDPARKDEARRDDASKDEARQATDLGSAADRPRPEALLAVVPTSGSTGRPKGVELSRRAFWASSHAHAGHLGWRPDDRWLLTLPLAHVGGLSIVTRCLHARRAVALPPAGRKLGSSELAEWVESSRSTLLSLVPTQLSRLLDVGWTPPDRLRAVLVGGAAAPVALLRRALGAGVPVLATYGATEACSQVATWSAAGSESESMSPEHLASVGPLLPGFEGRLARAEAGSVGYESAGVLELRGASLFSAYRTESGRRPRAVGSWWRTGDVARFDGAGRLHVLGRHDHVIVTGGENVHPVAVEAALLRHPAVAEAAVLGVASRDWGQAVVALLVAAQGSDPVSHEELAALLSAGLAGYARPKQVRWVSALPKTASGKLDRASLAALWEGSRTARSQ